MPSLVPFGSPPVKRMLFGASLLGYSADGVHICKKKKGPQVEFIRGEAIICFDPEFFFIFFS
jgi:hypothetical protein